MNNPATGRSIKRGGPTHKKLIKAYDTVQQSLIQSGGAPMAPLATINPNIGRDEIVIPKSKYQLITSALPPNQEEHSWYHHHSPFAQSFGDYVCLKRSTLQDMGTFLRDALFSDLR
jgi:hypothetical protein